MRLEPLAAVVGLPAGIAALGYLIARVTGVDPALRLAARRAGVTWRQVVAAVGVYVAGVVATAWLASASGGHAYVVGAALFLVGSGLTVHGSARLPGARAVSAPVESAANLPAGATVAVDGTARSDGETVTSPAGETCLAYETRTESYLRSIRLEIDFWLATDGVSDAVPFRVEDDTGTVRVDPEGASLHLAPEDRPRGPDDPEPRTLLSLEDAPSRRTERRLEAGDEVTVLGRSDGRILADGGPVFVVTEAPQTTARQLSDIRRYLLVGALSLVGGLGLMATSVGIPLSP